MGDLSNKTLAMVLMGTVIVSLLGTFLVLNNLGDDSVTGFASQSLGIVNLSIATTISITTNESSLVNFGACALNETRAINITSYRTEDTPTYCTTFVAPENISVRNDGNVIVNVSIATSVCSPGVGNISCTFLNLTTTPEAENGLFQYNITNAGRLSYTGGCGTVNGTSWTAFNGTSGVHACTNLATAAVANSFVANFRLRVPKGLPTGPKTTTITFLASQP